MMQYRIAYSIKAILPEHEDLNNKDLVFRSVPDKNDKVLFFKDNFNSMNEAVINSENKLKDYGSLSPLMVTYYSIGDKQK